MTGVGGDAFWLIHDARTGEVKYLNGGGKAAAGATLAVWVSTSLVPGDAGAVPDLPSTAAAVDFSESGRTL